MFRPLCDHIVYALYEVHVLHIGLNELSAGLDTVFGMLLFLDNLYEPLVYFIAHGVANLLGQFIYRTSLQGFICCRDGCLDGTRRLQTWSLPEFIRVYPREPPP